MKTTTLILIGVILLSVMSCSSPTGGIDNNDVIVTTLITEPEALFVDDEKYTGIYKGVIIGDEASSVFTVSVTETSGNISAQLAIKVNSQSLIIQGIVSENNGYYSYKFDLSKTDYYLELRIGVLSDGSSSGSSLSTFDLNAGVTYFKETSTALVEIFEGAIIGNISGKLGLLIKGTEVKGVISGYETMPLEGNITDLNLIGTLFDNTYSDILNSLIDGTRVENHLEGTWLVDSETNGTWTSERTR